MTPKDEIQTTWHCTGYSFKAMNTKVQTWLYSQQVDNRVLLEVQGLFHSSEKCLSYFDLQSELSHLNANEHEGFQASPVLLDAVEVALRAAEATHGLYDPTVLGAPEKAGYAHNFEQIEQTTPLGAGPSAHLPVRTPPRVLPASRSHPFTFRSVSVNRARREIYKPPGLQLNLGGMSKGWAVDRAADHLQEPGPFLVNANGNIFAYHSPPGLKGWEVDLVHPLKPEMCIARVQLHHRALATSTIAKRPWQGNGQFMHHLIDPRTGQPAQTDALSVSVVAERTVLAEIYAKVARILGAEQGLAYLQSLPGVEGLIYTAEAHILYTAGLASLLDRLEPAGYINYWLMFRTSDVAK